MRSSRGPLFLGIGFLSGLLGGLLGVGGGFIMVPLQVLYARQSQHQANGTSLAAVVAIGGVGAVLYYFAGSRPQLDLGFAGLLVLGGIPGAYLGAHLVNRLPERQLKMGMAVLLTLVAAKEIIAP